jgi:hypothetical protein
MFSADVYVYLTKLFNLKMYKSDFIEGRNNKQISYDRIHLQVLWALLYTENVPYIFWSIEIFLSMPSFGHLGGVMVSVLAIRPKVRGFKLGRGDGFLMAIKIRSTSSFGVEVKPEAPCSKILRHVKFICRFLLLATR